MKLKQIIFLLTLTFTASIAFSQVQQVSSLHSMILTGDPILEDIRYLSVKTGYPFLSLTPPLSPAEVRNFINYIDESVLSDYDFEVYGRILDKLSVHPPFLSWSLDDLFTIHVNISSAFDLTYNFNSAISALSQIPKSAPLFSMPVRLFIFDSLQLYIDPIVDVKPFNGGIGITNIPDGFPAEYWPIRAFASVGGPWWNFYIGRDHLAWGTAHSGNLIYSNEIPFYDFAYLSFFTPKFKYSIIINHLPLKLERSLFDVPPLGWSTWENRMSEHRYFYLHRMDIILFNRISFSAMEGVMVGNSPLELKYLNPMIIFHSMHPWNSYQKWLPGTADGKEGSTVGAFLSFEVNLNIIKPLAVYGQFVMNQVATQGELNAAIPPPNGLGYLAGIHYTHTFNTWSSLFYAEFVYTSPYVYVLSSPFASFIHRDNNFYLLGHSRDTVLLTAGANFTNINNTLKFYGNFSWTAKGEHNRNGLKWDHIETQEAFDAKSPTGTAENCFILSFDAEWKLLSWLVFKANITGIYSVNNNHIHGNNEVGGQTSLSVSIHF